MQKQCVGEAVSCILLEDNGSSIIPESVGKKRKNKPTLDAYERKAEGLRPFIRIDEGRERFGNLQCTFHQETEQPFTWNTVMYWEGISGNQVFRVFEKPVVGVEYEPRQSYWHRLELHLLFETTVPYGLPPFKSFNPR
ncbi:hypothetical protein L2E82_13455 [Cichorium intybus]|uniref:Uncharacterized protein n=1 Tax=Cichorium intybus TaxID=13427 RepID=A0ACB9EY29_CICIN|nr:hypothetical protein L2E82_13455 [Cichorium intybus]